MPKAQRNLTSWQYFLNSKLFYSDQVRTCVYVVIFSSAKLTSKLWNAEVFEKNSFFSVPNKFSSLIPDLKRGSHINLTSFEEMYFYNLPLFYTQLK